MKISELNAIFRESDLFHSGGLVIIKTISKTSQVGVAQKIAGLFCTGEETPEEIHIPQSHITCDNEYGVIKTLREIREKARAGGNIVYFQQPMNKNRFPDDVDGYFSRYHTSLRLDSEADMSVFAYEDTDGISIFIDKFRTMNQDIGPYILRRINIEE